MSKHWKSFVKRSFETFMIGGSGSKHGECYGAFKNLVRNSEYFKSKNLKKLSILAQILGFL